jgi:hypothetical protein
MDVLIRLLRLEKAPVTHSRQKEKGTSGNGGKLQTTLVKGEKFLDGVGKVEKYAGIVKKASPFLGTITKKGEGLVGDKGNASGASETAADSGVLETVEQELGDFFSRCQGL